MSATKFQSYKGKLVLSESEREHIEERRDRLSRIQAVKDLFAEYCVDYPGTLEDRVSVARLIEWAVTHGPGPIA